MHRADSTRFAPSAPDALIHPWPRGLAHDSVDHVLVVVSDIEMGAGGPTDDLPDTSFLERVLAGYAHEPFARVPVTYVFNGDTFDFLKTKDAHGRHPIHVTPAISHWKLRQIAAAHPTFFDTLGRLLAHREAPRSAVFVAGNHDPDLFFEEVQAEIRAQAGATESVIFPGLSWRQGDVLIEHGSQHDPMFAVDPDRPTLVHKGRTLLNLPWGTLAILEVLMPHLDLLSPLDRLLPHRAVFKAVPEVEELLLNGFWKYWTHDYWASFFGGSDPLRRVTWTMLSQIGYRFGTGDPDVRQGPSDRDLLRSNRDVRTICMGHLHEPRLESLDDRQLLRTSCFRNEFLADFEHGAHRLMPKVYAEVFMTSGRTRRSHLVQVDAPAPQPIVGSPDLSAIGREAKVFLDRTVGVSEDRDASNAQLRKEKRAAAQVAPGFFRTLWHALESRERSS